MQNDVLARWNRLVPPGSRVLIGYSGGADSTFLLHQAAEAGLDVVAAHLHHGMRPEADQELKLCEAFCEEIGVPFVSGRADVPRMSGELGMSMEEAGRTARYGFFNQAASQLQCAFIATAHTADDHAETILLNLARGTSLKGLAGIPEERDNIIRPILHISRIQTRDYCNAHGLWFHDDPANDDEANSRVRIRKSVVPVLKELNPSLLNGLTRTAEWAAQEDDLLNLVTVRQLEQIEIPLDPVFGFLSKSEEVFLETDGFRALPKAMQRRGIQLVGQALGSGSEPSWADLIAQQVNEQSSGSVTYPGARIVLEWDTVRIHARSLDDVGSFRYPVSIPGETFADSFGWMITAEKTSDPELVRDLHQLSTCIDGQTVKGEVYFRAATQGEMFHRIGLEKPKAISDLFSGTKMTLTARKRIPVICDFVGPIWIPGIGPAERVKLTSLTKQGLFLRFGPII